MKVDPRYKRWKQSQSGTWWVVGAGIATAIYGGVKSSQTNEQNKELSDEAREMDAQRREAIGKELANAVASLNKMREERPGTTYQEWANEYVKAISDPVLRENFRRVKEEDFNAAVDFAGQATGFNLQNFLEARDVVSQGEAPALTRRLNEITLGTNVDDAMKRAMELRAGYIPSGTVRYDAQGRLVEGQRADKQVKTTAFETEEAQRQLQFDRGRQLLSDYSTVAQANTEHAKDFLQFASLEPVARGLATNALQTAIGFQQQDEQNQFELIKLYAAGAAGIQPTQPQFQSTAASDKLTSEGIAAAIKGLSNYYA